jgi:hypothetical protein
VRFSYPEPATVGQLPTVIDVRVGTAVFARLLVEPAEASPEVAP